MKLVLSLGVVLVGAGLTQAQQQSDPVIEAARQSAAAFTRSLPDYIVKRTTTRYRAGRIAPTLCAGCAPQPWQKVDVVNADVVTENGRETQLNFKVDGKAVLKPGQKGSWSVGEFATVLQAVFSAASDAQFSNQRSTALGGRSAWEYDYSIEQAHSSWRLQVDASVYSPGYSGAIWIDKETSRILRIDMSAHGMPSGFAMQDADSTLVYGFVKIGEGNYLLPVHSQTVICQRTPAVCTRNATNFEDYKKYTADAVISFDDKTY